MISAPRAALVHLHAFFTWWTAGLTSLLPHRLRKGWQNDRNGLILELGPTDAVLLTRTTAGDSRLAALSLDAPDYHQRLKTIVDKVSPGHRRLTIRLAEQLGLRRNLDLPLAALNDLDQFLAFEIDRLTPFKQADVYYAHRVLRLDRDARRFHMELHVAPRCEVTRARELSRTLGLTIAQLQLTDPDNGHSTALNLYSEKPPRATSEKRLSCTSAILASVLTVAVFVVPVQRQLATAAKLEAQIAAYQAEADATLALAERLDQLSGQVRFLESVNSARPTATKLLAELTRLLPDQVHLVEVKLHNDIVEIDGIAEDANNLVVMLGNSSILKTPRFTAPVIHDSQSGFERFRISMVLANPGGN
jgi:general secretion pathway protein L